MRSLTQKFWTALPIQMEEAAKQLYARIRAVSWSRDFMIWQFVSPDVVILVPGDEIVGFVTRGRGVSIHRTDCINVLNMSELDRSRLIEAEWQQPDNKEKREVHG